MKPLLTPEALADLRACVTRRPLVGFDFDGTIAPIVVNPIKARVPAALAWRLQRLALSLPTAVVSGRRVDDLRRRLGFTPAHIVGNHGDEWAGMPDGDTRTLELDEFRKALHRAYPDLRERGVWVEDKRLSIAIHYRQAPDRLGARQAVEAFVAEHAGGLCSFGGKMVVNVARTGYQDKACAMHRLVEQCEVSHAIYFGDDVNDEPVFASAPRQWITVRVGSESARCSAARYFVHASADLNRVLDEMLRTLGATCTPGAP